MRLSPKSIFLGIVALGLPLVVTVGWIVGGSQAQPSAPTPGGAGGIGAAPVHGTSIGPTGDRWSPAPPRPVAVQTRVPLGMSRTEPIVRPSATRRDRPRPTSTPVAVPLPTEATLTPTEPPPTVPPSEVPPAVP